MRKQTCLYKPPKSSKVSQLQTFLDQGPVVMVQCDLVQGCDSGEAPATFPNPKSSWRVQSLVLPGDAAL